MALAILYRWRVESGKEADFRAAWVEGTRRIHERCGSLGARLHQASDGTFWSYALWPDEAARDRCFARHDFFSMPCFQTMQAAIVERFEEIPLEVTDDLLQGMTSRG